jgi:hypothetical protein
MRKSALHRVLLPVLKFYTDVISIVRASAGGKDD